MCANADREVSRLSVENTSLRAQLAAAERELASYTSNEAIEQLVRQLGEAQSRSLAAEAALEEFKRRERRRLYETCPDPCTVMDAAKCGMTKECHNVDAARLAPPPPQSRL